MLLTNALAWIIAVVVVCGPSVALQQTPKPQSDAAAKIVHLIPRGGVSLHVPPVHISGRLVDASGKPLELQTVALATRGNAFLNSRAIWQNGTFHFFVSHAVYQLRVDGIWLPGGAVRLIDASYKVDRVIHIVRIIPLAG